MIAVILLLVLAGAVAGIFRWNDGRTDPPLVLKLFGNVELRQIALPFNNSERIAELLVDEGDRVVRGQVLARLDTSRLVPALARAEAQVAAQRQVVSRLRRGARPEEIAQAQAALESAAVESADAARRHDRLAELHRSAGVSDQGLDTARFAFEAAEARRIVAEKSLQLIEAGPRDEDIAEAEARLRAAEAEWALLNERLIDAELRAPVDAVVRTRILEPGEISSPQRPVFTLAVSEPKWIRTYIGEADLGRIRPGMPARIVIDSFPDHRIEARVGHISAVAEFTPNTLQTEELRTHLVYEVRVLVTEDTADRLRLGMPVTVHLDLERTPISSADPD